MKTHIVTSTHKYSKNHHPHSNLRTHVHCCSCRYFIAIHRTLCILICSPLGPSDGLDKEVLFDLEQVGLQDTEAGSPSPVAASEYINLCLLNHTSK